MNSGRIKHGISGLLNRLNRRNFLKGSGLAVLTGAAGCSVKAPVKTSAITIPTYESIGVKPIINCLGTHTNRGGSLMLPEVIKAIEEGNKHYVRMDDLMEKVGERLAELTGAEFGCVTSGAAGAMFAATCACVAGTDPEKMALLPDTTGMKNEVLVAKDQRHVYDRSIWMAGVKMIEAETAEEMESKVTDKTAMIDVWGEVLHLSRISLKDMISIGKKHGIPVMVDAAAERPDVPNVYLKAGADLVCYSGGKCMRGPQSAGLLLGRKDLVRAAFLNISPHHALGRPMKVGKEEILGMLAATEMWVHGRDHKAEWLEWERKLKYISDAVVSIPTVKAEVQQPDRPSNYAPRLSITWDQNTVKIKPGDVNEQLYQGNPGIEMPYGRNGMTIMSYMLEEGDEVPVAQRLKEVLSGAV
ncbi:MAG: aminotransferase class V-fold PLP-dependent enzyme [Candidatus Latescibacteria bacterium]|nr:aminotransferase class V-fold PLP-dependent enzyme [Candidatus Latescibacterota bacterium]